jgi:hypothetical protein
MEKTRGCADDRIVEYAQSVHQSARLPTFITLMYGEGTARFVQYLLRSYGACCAFPVAKDVAIDVLIINSNVISLDINPKSQIVVDMRNDILFSYPLFLNISLTSTE